MEDDIEILAKGSRATVYPFDSSLDLLLPVHARDNNDDSDYPIPGKRSSFFKKMFTY